MHIPRHIQFSENGHVAYAEALEKDGHGDVVVIPRHGRMEYVIDHRHVKQVLTDAQNFSFELAVTHMLHMEFMLWFKNGKYVQELDKLVQEGVTPRLDAVIERISAVFSREAKRAQKVHQIADVYEWVHRTIAEAMVILILGEEYQNDKTTANFMAIVSAITRLAGIYENTEGWKHLPWLWSLKTSLYAIFVVILPRFFFGVLPLIWRNRDKHVARGTDYEAGHYAPFFDLLAKKYCNRDDAKLSLLNFLWCATICLGVIFASVHQTAVVAVWSIVMLAQKQEEYLPQLRAEWNEHVQVDVEGQRYMTMTNLRELSLLDSFIREVMRTKGDTFAPTRYTIADVRIGQFIVPKGSLCVPYVKRAHEHPANYGAQGTKFNGFQWHQHRKPAVQGGHDFISFGLGRWACPGRHLAVAEIKMVIIALFADNDVRIEKDSFVITDPMNATSVAPQAGLSLRPRTLEC